MPVINLERDADAADVVEYFVTPQPNRRALVLTASTLDGASSLATLQQLLVSTGVDYHYEFVRDSAHLEAWLRRLGEHWAKARTQLIDLVNSYDTAAQASGGAAFPPEAVESEVQRFISQHFSTDRLIILGTGATRDLDSDLRRHGLVDYGTVLGYQLPDMRALIFDSERPIVLSYLQAEYCTVVDCMVEPDVEDAYSTVKRIIHLSSLADAEGDDEDEGETDTARTARDDFLSDNQAGDSGLRPTVGASLSRESSFGGGRRSRSRSSASRFAFDLSARGHSSLGGDPDEATQQLSANEAQSHHNPDAETQMAPAADTAGHDPDAATQMAPAAGHDPDAATQMANGGSFRESDDRKSFRETASRPAAGQEAQESYAAQLQRVKDSYYRRCYRSAPAALTLLLLSKELGFSNVRGLWCGAVALLGESLTGLRCEEEPVFSACESELAGRLAERAFPGNPTGASAVKGPGASLVASSERLTLEMRAPMRYDSDLLLPLYRHVPLVEAIKFSPYLYSLLQVERSDLALRTFFSGLGLSGREHWGLAFPELCEQFAMLRKGREPYQRIQDAAFGVQGSDSDDEATQGYKNDVAYGRGSVPPTRTSAHGGWGLPDFAASGARAPGTSKAQRDLRERFVKALSRAVRRASRSELEGRAQKRRALEEVDATKIFQRTFIQTAAAESRREGGSEISADSHALMVEASLCFRLDDSEAVETGFVDAEAGRVGETTANSAKNSGEENAGADTTALAHARAQRRAHSERCQEAMRVLADWKYGFAQGWLSKAAEVMRAVVDVGERAIRDRSVKTSGSFRYLELVGNRPYVCNAMVLPRVASWLNRAKYAGDSVPLLVVSRPQRLRSARARTGASTQDPSPSGSHLARGSCLVALNAPVHDEVATCADGGSHIWYHLVLAGQDVADGNGEPAVSLRFFNHLVFEVRGDLYNDWLAAARKRVRDAGEQAARS